MNQSADFALWVIIVLLLLAFVHALPERPGQRVLAGHLVLAARHEVSQGHVRDVVIPGAGYPRHLHQRLQARAYAPNDPTLVKRLYDGKVQITAKPPGDNVP